LVDACRDNPLVKYFQNGKHKGTNAKKGLGQVTPTVGQVVIGFATSAGDTADDGNGNMSPYAKALSVRLKEPNKDITKVLGLVALDVQKNHKQYPIYRANLAYDVWLYGGDKQTNYLLDDATTPPKSSEKYQKEKYSLSINTTPSNAKVYIMGIKPRYKNGIKLEKGAYKIKVKAIGYETKVLTIELNSDISYDVALIELKNQSKKNRWLTDKIYGSDNDVASLRNVNIYKKDNQLRIKIDNQFNFDCELKLDSEGKPKTLLNCKSQDKPSPICDPDRPNSYCAKALNCFRKLPEVKPECYNVWMAKENIIELSCTSTKTEDICRGKYNLGTNNDFSMGEDRMTIAKKRR